MRLGIGHIRSNLSCAGLQGILSFLGLQLTWFIPVYLATRTRFILISDVPVPTHIARLAGMKPYRLTCKGEAKAAEIARCVDH